MIIIFTGGEHPSISHTQNFINNIKKTDSNPPTIIAADSGLSFCMECKFVPDIICGDFDSIQISEKNESKMKNTAILKKEFPFAKIQKWPKDKDFTDTEIALKEAHQIRKQSNFNYIILVGGDGGRVDHLIANLKLFKDKKAPDFWLCKNQYVQIFHTKQTYNIKTKLDFSIFSIPNKKNKYKIETSNVFWPLNNLKWENNKYSLSNRCIDNSIKAQFKIKKGEFLFVSCY